MNKIKTKVDEDRFAEFVGIRLTEVTPGSARAELEIGEEHLNGLGTAHGGVIFTLADIVFAAAANSHGVDAMAVNINISYFKALRKGLLRAHAKEISLNRKLATYAVEVTDETGDRVAVFQGTAYRRTQRAGVTS